MARVHWYNPENDLALAVDATNYTPPRGPLHLQQAGAALPFWYADAGDKVLCYGVNAAWFEGIRSRFDIKATLFDHEPKQGDVPDPWGWSSYARKFFLDEGFSPEVLPSDETLERLRALSHRRTGAKVASLLAEALPNVPMVDHAVELFSVDEVRIWLAAHPHSFLKMPWSSSGRGVLDSMAISPDAVMSYAANSIRRQGSVMAEIAHDKVLDFARIFECRGGICHDLGTSVFTTASNSTYLGNLLASEAVRFGKVCQYVVPDALLQIIDALRDILDREIAPYYEGVLGVDMLVTADGRIDPVVEINLRKTMGYVALRFCDMYLHERSEGSLQVISRHDFEPSATSPIVEDCRLLDGRLSLTPLDREFAYIADVHPVQKSKF